MKVIQWSCIIIILLAACNEQKQQQTENTDTTTSTETLKDTTLAVVISKDSALHKLHIQVLEAFKAKDYRKIANFFHPAKAVRFSPYGYVDTQYHRSFSAAIFVNSSNKEAKLFWGNYDGSGDSIILDLPAYMNKFVYNADFLHAPQFSINKRLGQGNSLHNINKIYPGADFTESYFPGFEEKYGGMDWTSLRLVFESVNDKYYLVAVVHDQWTS